MPKLPKYEIAVVTRAPMGPTNMALNMDVYVDTGEPDPEWGGALKKVVPFHEALGAQGSAVLALRKQVFRLGEILFLGNDGREILNPGRKPDKWDVAITYVDSLEAALTLSLSLEEGT